MVKKAKVKTNYINNQDFLAALTDYRQKLKEAEEQGKNKPKIPDYICECFVKIATNLAKKGCFASYTWKDEMIADAIENQLLYFHNFDPEKSNYAFAYFTKICKFAFFRRIAKEKKQQYIKYKTAENFDVLDEEEFADLDFDPTQFALYENNYEFIAQYEQTMVKKKDTIKKPKGIELFFGD